MVMGFALFKATLGYELAVLGDLQRITGMRDV